MPSKAAKLRKTKESGEKPVKEDFKEIKPLTKEERLEVSRRMKEMRQEKRDKK